MFNKLKQNLSYVNYAKNILFKPLQNNYLPGHLQIEVTTYCNMNCLSCGRRYIVDQPKHMTFASFKKIYDNVRPRNINLSGLGEPLLNPEIFEMIDYARKHRSIVNFPTNLSVGENQIKKLVQSRVNQIKVSLDAASRATYQTVRQVDKFDLVIENIRSINALKKAYGHDFPVIRINFCLQTKNLAELPLLLKLAKELKVSTVYIQDLNYFSIEAEKDKLCGFTKSELVAALQNATLISKDYRINTNLENWQRNLDDNYNKMLPISEHTLNNIKCNFPWISSFIDVNGEVYACPVFVWDKNRRSLGNCLEVPFSELWNGEKYIKLRTDFKKNIRENEICKRCVPPRFFDMNLIFKKMLLRTYS